MSLKKKYINILFVLISTLLFASCEKKPQYLNEELIEVLNNIDRDADANYYEDLLKEKGAYQTPEVQGFLYGVLGIKALDKRQLELSNHYFEAAENELENKATNGFLTYKSYANIGILLYIRNLSSQSSKYLNRAIQKAEEVENFEKDLKYVQIIRLAADEAYALKMLDKSIELGNNALQILDQLETDDEKNKKTIRFDVLYNQFGSIRMLDEIRNPSEEKLLELKNILDQAEESIVDDRRKTFFISMKADYFKDTRQYDSAVVYSNKHYQVIKKDYLEDPTLINQHNNTGALVDLLNTYSLTDTPEDGQPYFEELTEIEKTLDKNSESANFAEIKYDIRSAQAYYLLLTKQYSKMTSALDSVYLQHQKAVHLVSEEATNYQESIYKAEISKKDASIKKFEKRTKNNARLKVFYLLSWLAIALILYLSYRLFKSERKEHLHVENLNKMKTDLLQQKMLLTQMEPHFVFNSLNSIKSLINLDKKEESIDFITDFSYLLRTTIEQSREDFVPLTTEIETIKSYVNIHKLKNKPFQFHLDIDEVLLQKNILIPPMLIQPFVENSIIHGILPLTNREGILQLSLIPSKEKSMIIQIIDNGVGMNKQRNKTDKSYAIQIVQERLDLLAKYTDSKTSLTIKNGDSEGVLVTIEIPYIV